MCLPVYLYFQSAVSVLLNLVYVVIATLKFNFKIRGSQYFYKVFYHGSQRISIRTPVADTVCLACHLEDVFCFVCLVQLTFWNYISVLLPENLRAHLQLSV